MKKISYNELSEIKEFEVQGGSWSKLYSAKYNELDVVVKAQLPGSLNNTDHNDDRFEQELKVYKLKLSNTVHCYGWEDDFEGERFVVLEKLLSLPEEISLEDKKILVRELMICLRKLYLKEISWVAHIDHIGFSKKDKLFKIMDFNDDIVLFDTFFNDNYYYNFLSLFSTICSADWIEVYQYAISELIEEEYQSLDDVHQPIYFDKYSGFLRTERDPNDKNFGRLVQPVRVCTDRAEVLKLIILKHNDKLFSSSVPSALDIGCNVGWMSFFLNSFGFKVTGIDLDNNDKHRPKDWQNGTGGKIDLAKLLAEVFELSHLKFERAFFDEKYIESMLEYDFVLALSVFHLYFTQHNYSQQGWFSLFRALSDKVKRVLIIETDNVLQDFDRDLEAFVQILVQIGNYTSYCVHPMPHRPIIELVK